MPGGRPLTLRDEIENPEGGKITKAQAIVDAIKLGVPRDIAAKAAGVGERTFYTWLARGAELQGLAEAAAEQGIEPPDLSEDEVALAQFRQDVENADAAAIVYAVAMVRRAMPDTWQAAMTWLERRYPGEWGRRLEVKTDPADRKPATADADLAARAEETFLTAVLPDDLAPDDFLPSIGDAQPAEAEASG